MKLIIGLGNPGREYENTRHNAGFLVIDRLLNELNIDANKIKFNGHYCNFNYAGEKIIILKPDTYMNNSGECVLEFVNYYDIDIDDIIVVHDDLDLPVGSLRLRQKGSAGGQKGMDSIIRLLKSNEIKRIRVGISNNKNIDTKDYVLSKFTDEEKPLLMQAINSAKDALIYSFKHDFELVMNHYNIKVKEE